MEMLLLHKATKGKFDTKSQVRVFSISTVANVKIIFIFTEPTKKITKVGFPPFTLFTEPYTLRQGYHFQSILNNTPQLV